MTKTPASTKSPGRVFQARLGPGGSLRASYRNGRSRSRGKRAWPGRLLSAPRTLVRIGSNETRRLAFWDPLTKDERLAVFQPGVQGKNNLRPSAWEARGNGRPGRSDKPILKDNHLGGNLQGRRLKGSQERPQECPQECPKECLKERLQECPQALSLKNAFKTPPQSKSAADAAPSLPLRSLVRLEQGYLS